MKMNHNRSTTVAILVLIALTLICGTTGAKDLDTGFSHPPHSAGIRSFWWWLNSHVTKEAITHDLEEMKAKGYNGAMIFDADGSSQQGNRSVPAGPLFAGPEWTELFVHACTEAKRLDLELSLNIQSGWNLGGPKVTEAEATQTLVWTKTEIRGPATLHQVLKSAGSSGHFYRDIAVIAVPMPQVQQMRPIKDLSLKSATRELGGSAPDCRYLLDTAPARSGDLAVKRGDILNVTAKMIQDGTLRWDVPEGDWVLIRFGHTATGAHVSTQSAGWGGRVLDYLNPDSLDAYWTRNIKPLFDAIGPMAGTTLRYIHTDSWEGGGMNWTPGFDRTFKDHRGYDPFPWLAVLAGYVIDSREDSNAFLADFRKTIGDRVADHYGQLAELAQTYGMGTHPECSGPHAGPLDGLKNYGRSELMMSEFWSPSPHRPTPPNRFFVKQAASAAHTYGKRLVGAEGFTTIGPHWNDVPWSAMKPSFDHEFCAGLNLVFNHTFTCSPKEMGLPGQEYFAGTHLNPQVTWWDEAPALIDYFKRCQYLAQQGDFVADVVYYYGDHIPNIATLKESDPAGALPDFDYDVLSEELLLTRLTVKKGCLSLPSGMTYRVLVLPDHRVLSLGALKTVDKLVRAGGTVLGPKPLRAVSLEGGTQGRALFQRLADGLWGSGEQAWDQPGSRKVGKGRIAWGLAARDLLHGDGIASDVTFQDEKMGSSINWIHYRIGDADVYFLSEPNGKARSVTAIFRGDGRLPELWNAVDGSMRDAATFKFVNGCTQVPLKFDAYGSTFVVLRKKSGRDRNDAPNFPTWQEKQLISGPWDVTFDAKWGGPKGPVRFETLTDWIQHSDPGIKYYSGKAVYRTTVTIGDELAGKQLAIELGQVKDVCMASVKLNGTDLGVVWRPPFRVDVSRAIKPGKNELEVMVVNSWRNRVIGDQTLPQDKRLTQTNIKVIKTGSKTWTLEPSGLLGPVLVTEKIMGFVTPDGSPRTIDSDDSGMEGNEANPTAGPFEPQLPSNRATVHIDTGAAAKPYDAMIFGGFMEHFGHQIYGGVFEPGSPLADEAGFRTDVIAALKALKVPVIRWPGGCFVDGYHWQKGVGKNREPYGDPRWGVIESNRFGTHEFIELCRRLDAEPYICHNSFSTVQEMADWVAYCNATEGKFAELRRQNGHPEPFNVKFWSVGNERYDKAYIHRVRDGAKAMKQIDSSVLVTCAGSQGGMREVGSKVSSYLLETAGEDLDYISVHNYWLPRADRLPRYDYMTAITKSEWPEAYMALVCESLDSAGLRVRGRLKIAFDEWNLRAWQHPGFPRNTVKDYQATEVRALVEQRVKENAVADQYTMADALFAASFFNACLRHSKDVSMANIAPLVNTRGPLFVHPRGIVKRTHFHSMAMYANLLQDRVAKMVITAGKLTHGKESVAVVDAIATVDKSGESWSIALVNRHPSDSVACTIKMKELLLDGEYDATVLAGESADSYNDIKHPNRVAPKKSKLTFRKGVASLPAHSLTIVHVSA